MELHAKERSHDGTVLSEPTADHVSDGGLHISTSTFPLVVPHLQCTLAWNQGVHKHKQKHQNCQPLLHLILLVCFFV